MVVIESEGLVVVVNLGHVGIGEDAHEQLPLGALTGLNLAIGFANPAAIPLVLVFPFFRVTNAWLGLDVVEPSVFHAWTAGTDVFAGD